MAYQFPHRITFATATRPMRSNRLDWDLTAQKEHAAHVARNDRQAWESIRLAPYWYDKVYGTNHCGLKGRIPSMLEIERGDKRRAS